MEIKPIVASINDLVEKTRYWVPEGEEIPFDNRGWRSVWNAAFGVEKLLYPDGRKVDHVEYLEQLIKRFDEFLASLGWLDFYTGKRKTDPNSPIRIDLKAVDNLAAAVEIIESGGQNGG